MKKKSRPPHDAAADDDGVHRIREIGGQMSAPIETRGIAVRSFDPERRTVTVEFSHGAAVRRRAWVNGRGVVEYDEILEVSERAVDLRRLKAGAPVLDSHFLYSTRAQLAVTENPRIEGDVAVSDIRFPSPGVDEDADRMASMVSEGIIKNISCGYSRDKIRIEPPKKDGDVEKWIVERWTPHEISFVTIGADLSAQVRGQAESGEAFPVVFNRATPITNEDEMKRTLATGADETPENIEQRAAADPVSPAVNVDEVRAKAVDAERKRIALVNDLGARHSLGADWIKRMIDSGVDENEIRSAALTELAKADEKDAGGARHVLDPMVGRQDEGDTLRLAVSSAIELRSNAGAYQPNTKEFELARAYRSMSLLEIGRVFLEESSGQRVRGMSRRELAGALLGLNTRGGYQGAGDFANLLANVIQKRLRRAYEVAPQNWKLVGRKANFTDFKERLLTQLSAAPTFKKVVENGEYTYGQFTDAAERISLSTYGVIVGFSRQALINDDLSAFDRVPALMGRQAAEREAAVFWSILTQNANMADGVALFHATHGNLGTAGAINETTLTEAKKLMREQKSFAKVAADQEPLNITPKYLIVGPAKEVEAAKMLAQFVATKSGDVNVFQGSLDLLVEARLTGNAWYLSADPEAFDTIEYGYLDGDEGVYLEQRTGFEIDGLEVKGRIDFAAKAVDHRGLFKNAGN